MSLNQEITTGRIVFAALMPHAPVLVPAVGGNRLKQVAGSVEGMRAAARRLVASQPDTLVLISPHSPRRANAFGIWGGKHLSGSLAQFGLMDELFNLPVDSVVAESITAAAREALLETWIITESWLDHGAVVPLWFLVEAGWNGPTVVLSLKTSDTGDVDTLGRAIRRTAEQTGRRVAILASGDMSHSLMPGAPGGYHPRARQFDAAFIDLLRAGNYREIRGLDPELRDWACEDVVESTLAAVSAVDGAADGHEVLSYEGPFGVGYGVAVLFDAAFIPPATAFDLQEGRVLPWVARQSVSAALGRPHVPPPPAAGYLQQRLGVFVTVRERTGKLRGCVGSIFPQKAQLVDETWRIAREAALADGRFHSVTAEELPELQFEVSVIYPPEPVAGEEDLDPARYGVIIAGRDHRRGVLLPGIPGLETPAQQLKCARTKACLGAAESIQISRFEIDKFIERE